MYNNIEYTEIREFIDNDIINNKTINNSQIISSSFFGKGGARAAAREPTIVNRINRDTIQNQANNIMGDKAINFSASLVNGLNFNSNNKINPNNLKYNKTESPLLNTSIVLSAGFFIINLVILNKDNLTSQEFFYNIITVIAILGGCLGITEIRDFVKYMGKLLQGTEVVTAFTNDASSIATKVNDIWEQGGGNIKESIYSLVDNIYEGYDYLKELLYSAWELLKRFYNNFSIKNKLDEFKNWLSSDKIDQVPSIDNEMKNEINKIISEMNNNIKKNPINNYYFNESSGKIIYIGNTNFKEIRTIISSNINYHIKSIIMITKNDKSINYLINDIEIDSITLIQGKPVHTALVLAYMSKNFIITSNKAKKYLYEFDNNGKIKVYLKNIDGTVGKEVSTISRAISSQINNEEKNGLEYIKESCKEIFGYNEGLSKESCSKHFYSILGRSAIAMIQNIGLEMDKKPDIYNIILSSNLGIQYEILKNLNWTIKRKTNNLLEFINVDEWLVTIELEKNSIEYKKYLNEEKPKVKELLNKMVQNINLESKILNNNKEIELNQVKKRNRRIISKEKIDKLKYISLGENLILNKFSNSYKYNQIGGIYYQNIFNKQPTINKLNITNKIELNYNILKDRLSNFNKKLSNITDNKILEKIQDLKTLQKELDLIYNKIINYIQILKKEENLILNNKIINIDEIDNLINQYNKNTSLQNKKIIVLSSAIGKIEILIEDNKDENIKKQYYHSI